MFGGKRELVLMMILAGFLLAGCTGDKTTVETETSANLGAEYLFIEKCTYCHALGTISSKDKTRYGWMATVNIMIEKYGADQDPGMTEEEIETIVDYLTENY